MKNFKCRGFAPLGVLLISLLDFGVASAMCLDGRHPTVENETRSSDIVIIGTAVEKTDYSSPDDPEGIARTKYVVKVNRTFKGRRLKTLVVGSDNTSSRFPLVFGEQYLLFISGPSSNGFIDSCGNSGLLDEKTDVIAELYGRRTGASDLRRPLAFHRFELGHQSIFAARQL